MKTLAISVKERQNVGKSNTRALRNQGNVPCVLYGGEKQVTFYAHENDFRNIVYTPDTFLIQLDVEGIKINAIIQEIQFHPVTDKILHIDFYQLFDDKEIAMDIPVVLNGNPLGVKAGGVLRRNRRKLRIKALPTNLPDNIQIDISGLKIGNKVYVSELLNDDYKFLHSDNTVVCQVKQSRVSVDIEEDEEDEEVEPSEGGSTEGSKENPTPPSEGGESSDA